MTGMIFGEVPDFAEFLDATRQLEQAINQAKSSHAPGINGKMQHDDPGI